MRELRFHRALYRGESVDEAAKKLDRFATITRAEEEGHWVLRIEASSPARERRVADELANFALGLTIRARGQAGPEAGR
ncbi:MAG: HxsD-like protein [Sandaracinaceae bacterium]